ncbi:MAG TPA: type II toxin-antitoxin system Phd/YefM family antitoxin [Verrucomicrobiales bacterium]|nr:type II toxin-antitoxin system Phd/YefM family antitoxin [Verrucomicrobiales bacterium]
MVIKATHLRKNIYQILDGVIVTGQSIEIERHGKRLKLVLADQLPKLSQLGKRKVMNCDPKDLVHLDWSDDWKHDLP